MKCQVESAIEILSNPSADQNLKSQAFTFLNQLREDASGWQVALSLFTRTPSPSEVVRHVCLEIVNNAVQTQRLDQQSLSSVKYSLLEYVRQRYSQGSTEVDSPGIQNKLTQAMTYLFTALYPSEWTTFFDDFRALAGDAGSIGSTNTAGTLLYLRIVGSVHDEIADLLIPRTQEEQKRNNDLKDLVRARDAEKISLSWQEILSRWRQVDLGIVEMCLKTISRWVIWIDISLVVNQTIISSLFDLAGQQGNITNDSKEARVRDAALDTFTETVGKKMPPANKIELINYLNLGVVVGQLVASPALTEQKGKSTYDTDLAESVAKLVNNVVNDVVRVLDNNSVDDATRSKAEELLQTCVPHLLRFFSDEYDEICSVVIPSLTDLITMFRQTVKTKGGLPAYYASLLPPILDAIIAKMKYDETSEWGTEDAQTEEADFQELRRRLHVLQQAVAAVDESLYMTTLSRVVADTFSRLGSSNKPDWRDLDLALHEMYLFGELAVKNGGLYQKSNPSTAASSTLLDMVSSMVNSDLASYPHPAVQLQYMEICSRYCQYFEHNPTIIPKVLENFVRFVHSDHVKVRTRSWYLFQRFVRHLRAQLGDVAQMVVQAVGDLLAIRAELPEDKDEDDISSEDNDQSADAVFTSQLYLFEAIGCVSSTASVPIDTKIAIAKSVINPLLSDMNQHVAPAKSGDARAVLQVHHAIMALGTLARGFSDWQPGQTASAPPPSELALEFDDASEATLLALEALKHSLDIRTASRFAFSRYLGIQGSRVLPQLPRWIDGLLSQTSSKDEMAMFLRLLAQVLYSFKTEIYDILDQLLSPLLQRVFGGLSEAVSGTDDEVQLKELKQQYLNFILVILNNDLAAILISQSNQGVFETFISTLTHFARDPSDPPAARMALSVLTRMTAVFGGPDMEPTSTSPPNPSVPGFDSFILSHFASLPWDLVRAPSFNPKDAQIRSVTAEAASLQWTISRKVGAAYVAQLQAELRGLGVDAAGVAQFGEKLAGDMFGFRKFFTSFVQSAAGG